jgi:hypothetical protein
MANFYFGIDGRRVLLRYRNYDVWNEFPEMGIPFLSATFVSREKSY